jgi:hypothetical protein
MLAAEFLDDFGAETLSYDCQSDPRIGAEEFLDRRNDFIERPSGAAVLGVDLLGHETCLPGGGHNRFRIRPRVEVLGGDRVDMFGGELLRPRFVFVCPFRNDRLCENVGFHRFVTPT